MILSLTDELRQKNANKFQLDRLNPEFIDETLSNNPEGIFNLPSKMPESSRKNIYNHLILNYKNFEFELNYDQINSELMFKKKGEIKNA